MAVVSIKNKVKKGNLLTTYPGKMATPTATDSGTGTAVSVAFTAVSGATGYQAISNPGFITATGSSSPITVSGLTSGTAYTFQVQAQNSVGYGGYSDASNSVTPVVPPGFDSFATVTVGGGTSASSLTFSSIPQTHSHLRLILSTRGTSSLARAAVRFNSDSSSNYYDHYWYGNGSSSGYGYDGGLSLIELGVVPTSSEMAYVQGQFIVDIFDYRDTSKVTTVRSMGGVSGSTRYFSLNSGVWKSTSAVTTLTIVPGLVGSGNFNEFTVASLYGIG